MRLLVNADETLASIRQAFGRYPTILANYNACKSRDNREIIWRSYNRPWIPAKLSFEDFVKLAETQQYSFMTKDGALFLLSYKFNRTGIEKASLGFYAPRHIYAGLQDDNELEDRSEHDTAEEDPEIEDDTKKVEEDFEDSLTEHETTWLRIDTDFDAKKGMVHPASHLHVDTFPEMRLPVRGTLTPVQFVDLIVSLVYPDVYCEKHLLETGAPIDEAALRADNRNTYPAVDTTLIESFIHLRVPGIVRIEP